MELQDLLSKIDELNREIAQARPVKPELEQRIMEKFRLDWNYHSNAIEGNKLTLGETKAFLLEGLTAAGKPLKDHFDIRGHDAVISFLVGYVQRKEVLTEADIREFHKMLLHEPYQVKAITAEGGTTAKWVKLGEYKTEPNSVQTATGAVKQFTRPEDTPAKMRELMEWLRSETEKKSVHPIILAAIFHHQFTQIHPFDDGNGRMARILMNLILMQNQLLPVVIKLIEREKYIAALTRADVGEQNDLIALIANEEIHSQEIFLKGAQGEDISDFDDVDKRVALLKQELQHKEKPIVLSPEVQAGFVSEIIFPLTSRLRQKMAQFDELFATNTEQVRGKHQSSVSPSIQVNWIAASGSNEEMLGDLVGHIEQGNQFTNITLEFRWSEFQRAELNTFGYSFKLHFNFEKYRYNLNAVLADGRCLYDEKNTYQYSPSEDAIHQLLNDLAEAFLKYIESEIKPK